MLTVLFRIIVICFFGLLGFTNLLVLRDVFRDLKHHHQFGDFTGWSQRVMEELLKEHLGSHRSAFQDLMPTILSLILIFIFYLSGNLIVTDVLVALLIFNDAQIVRDHLKKRPPLVVRVVLHARDHPESKRRDSKWFLLDVALQTVVSLGFTILPYIYVLITK